MLAQVPAVSCLVGVAGSWGLFITCWAWRNLGNFTY